ncbi:hypothetical protein EDB92DRAFT_1866147 [Lactarius akahatsu]|uniref:Secreted protein n=1 Tax=Lactarius akahatsu TaxID=416441 RepID=A0AAD4LG36_9AGAM|nr:hypothetical protein EDB92DRAFT_1866147 [Lactarius akahatsu]
MTLAFLWEVAILVPTIYQYRTPRTNLAYSVMSQPDLHHEVTLNFSAAFHKDSVPVLSLVLCLNMRLNSALVCTHDRITVLIGVSIPPFFRSSGDQA